MKRYAFIVDDFIKSVDSVREIAINSKPADLVNPEDNQQYSRVHVLAADSPLLARTCTNLSTIMGSRIQPTLAFFRFSYEGGYVPYHAHSDAFMDCQYTAVTYLNKAEHCRGGTCFLRHVGTGLTRWNKHTDPEDHARMQSEGAEPLAWVEEFGVPMAPGRVVIYPSELIHWSQPLGGFGSTPEDGRLVFVTLFNLVK